MRIDGALISTSEPMRSSSRTLLSGTSAIPNPAIIRISSSPGGDQALLWMCPKDLRARAAGNPIPRSTCSPVLSASLVASGCSGRLLWGAGHKHPRFGRDLGTRIREVARAKRDFAAPHKIAHLLTHHD